MSHTPLTSNNPARRARGVALLAALCFLAACASAGPWPAPALVPSPAPTLAPSPTLVPSPTPTATPIPPLALSIRWPDQVSALQPVSIQVELIPPPGVGFTATVAAAVLSPDEFPNPSYGLTLQTWDTYPLAPRGENLYAADKPLELPLEPVEGDWRLLVHVRSGLEVEGKQTLTFRPAPIRFRDLAGILPGGADLHVPQDFAEAAAQGDSWAGMRAWRYGQGEVALWWAPGPTEPLLLNNAVVMLEATHDPAQTPRVSGVKAMEWQGQTAFLFSEEWPYPPGSKNCPAEALVVQGRDFWLYVLRVRALQARAIPPLLRQVWGTFTLNKKY